MVPDHQISALKTQQKTAAFYIESPPIFPWKNRRGLCFLCNIHTLSFNETSSHIQESAASNPGILHLMSRPLTAPKPDSKDSTLCHLSFSQLYSASTFGTSLAALYLHC